MDGDGLDNEENYRANPKMAMGENAEISGVLFCSAANNTPNDFLFGGYENSDWSGGAAVYHLFWNWEQ